MISPGGPLHAALGLLHTAQKTGEHRHMDPRSSRARVMYVQLENNCNLWRARMRAREIALAIDRASLLRAPGPAARGEYS